MSLKNIKFGDKEINKKEFYSSKQAIPLDHVYSTIMCYFTSNEWIY